MPRASPSPYWLLRMAAERDDALSMPARHVFNRILSMRAIKNAEIDDVFPLPWPVVARWLNLKEVQCLVYLKELEQAGYVRREGIKGCPPTRQIRIVEAMGSKTMKNQGLKAMKKQGLKTVEKQGFKTTKKEGHLIYSLSDKEELKGERTPRRKIDAPLGGGETSAVSAVAATGVIEDAPAMAENLKILDVWRESEGRE